MDGNERAIWAAALMIGAVFAAAIWGLRLVVPWEPVENGSGYFLGVGGATVLAVVAGVSLRSWPAGVAAFMVLGAVMTFAVHDAITHSGWIVATFIAFMAVAFLAAWQWSNRWMRGALIVFVTLSVLLVLRTGRLELEDDLLRDTRAKATALLGEIPEPPTSLAAKREKQRTEAEAAVDVARVELGKRLADQNPDDPAPSGCVTAPAPAEPYAALCSVLGALRDGVEDMPGTPEVALPGAKAVVDRLERTPRLAEGQRLTIAAFAAAADAVSLAAPMDPAVSIDKASKLVKELCASASGEVLRITGNSPDSITEIPHP